MVPRAKDKPCVLHKDENSRNNRPENLMWGTQKENLNAPGFLKYCRGRTGDNNPYVKGKLLRDVHTRKVARAFSLAECLSDEMIERGWTTEDVVRCYANRTRPSH